MQDLQSKTIIVTGAGSGIGVGIAEVLAEQKAAVAVVDRDEPAAQRTAKSLSEAGVDAEAFTCDVSDEVQVTAMVDAVLQRFGRIDGLVNNAGILFSKPFEQMSVAEWDAVMAVDLRGTFLCIRACIETFLAQGRGSVVNIASVHSIASVPGESAYDAAKWGMVGMTKALAVEYASRNVRFNSLSPGLIDTHIWQTLQQSVADREAYTAYWHANIPAGRIGKPREIGQAAAFLLSDQASYITGSNLVADGGMTSQLISQQTNAQS